MGAVVRLKKNCKVCGKEMILTPAFHDHSYCSKECQYKDAVNKVYSPESRVKMSRSATARANTPYERRRISEMRKKELSTPEGRENLLRRLAQSQRSHHTSIECAVYTALTNRGIDYEEQYLINNKFIVDAYIPGRNLVIEVDGDYWHSLEKTVKKDKAENAYLSKCGFNLLRLPEHTIRSGEYLHELEGVLN